MFLVYFRLKGLFYKHKSDQVLALSNFTTPILFISKNLSRAHVLLTSGFKQTFTSQKSFMTYIVRVLMRRN